MKRLRARSVLPRVACGVALAGLGAVAFDQALDASSRIDGWRRAVAARVDWPTGLEIRIRVCYDPR